MACSLLISLLRQAVGEQEKGHVSTKRARTLLHNAIFSFFFCVFSATKSRESENLFSFFSASARTKPTIFPPSIGGEMTREKRPPSFPFAMYFAASSSSSSSVFPTCAHTTRGVHSRHCFPTAHHHTRTTAFFSHLSWRATSRTACCAKKDFNARTTRESANFPTAVANQLTGVVFSPRRKIRAQYFNSQSVKFRVQMCQNVLRPEGGSTGERCVSRRISFCGGGGGH